MSRDVGVVMTVLVAAAAVLAGCAAQPAEVAVEDSVDLGADAPTFSGPFAVDYTEAWNETDSQFIHEALRDEKVSEAELAEAVERLIECAADHGMEIEEYRSKSGYSVAPSELDGDLVNQLLGECEKQSGEHPLSYLYRAAITNPENRDFNELMVECLVRNKVVAAGYTAEEFIRDNTPPFAFPYLLDPATGESIFWQCNDDPRTDLGKQ